MVPPAWPPMTGTSMVLTSRPLRSATKVRARTMSSVVTPKILFLLYLPIFLSCSAAIATVELTGLQMISTTASGQNLRRDEGRRSERSTRNTKQNKTPGAS